MGQNSDTRLIDTWAMKKRKVHEEIGPYDREPNGLSQVRLRDIGVEDKDFLAILSTPEVEGEWNTFDDPPEERLSGSHYGAERAIADELFAISDSNRVEADTDIGNTRRRQLQPNPIRLTAASLHRISVRCGQILRSHQTAQLMHADVTLDTVAIVSMARRNSSATAHWRLTP
jgi:hypothetical protein